VRDRNRRHQTQEDREMPRPLMQEDLANMVVSMWPYWPTSLARRIWCSDPWPKRSI
jgi:bisphosphoglycerate-dependent phosphoglycerate mutase